MIAPTLGAVALRQARVYLAVVLVASLTFAALILVGRPASGRLCRTFGGTTSTRCYQPAPPVPINWRTIATRNS